MVLVKVQDHGDGLVARYPGLTRQWHRSVNFFFGNFSQANPTPRKVGHIQATVPIRKLSRVPASTPAGSVTKTAFLNSVYPASKPGEPVSLATEDAGVEADS